MFDQNDPNDAPAPAERWAGLYAAAGFRVVVLRPRSKQPAASLWQSRATSDSVEAARQTRGLPGCNLGLLMGVQTGRSGHPVAIDVDPRNGGEASLRRWEEEYGRLPVEAPRALTGGGGQHYLLWCDRPIASRTLAPGLEVKGRGSQIVVEPSVHPKTGREYVWDPGRPSPLGSAVAIPPRWRDALIGPVPDLVDRPGRREAAGAGGRERAPGAAGEGELLAWAIRRFPIEAVGDRNDRQRQLVCSLVCRGLDERAVLGVGSAWLDHFDALGLIGTPRAAAQYFLEACERSARLALRSGRLRPAVDHDALCRAIELADWQKALLRGGPCHSHIKGKSVLAGLCQTGEERKFVEAWLVQTLHRLLHTDSKVLTATHRQINQVAKGRYRMGWDPRQLERLMEKYVTRPGKPASRCELLVRTVEGRREGGEAFPSEYRIEKLAFLIVPDPDDEDGPDEPAPWEFDDSPDEPAPWEFDDACGG